MQGNRAHMEDRFSMLADTKRNIYLYGVFDGHGGKVSVVQSPHSLTWVSSYKAPVFPSRRGCLANWICGFPG